MRSGAEAWSRRTALPLVVLVLPWRCNLVAPPAAESVVPEPRPSAIEAKQEAAASRVSSVPPRTPPVRSITLPEEVVVKAVGVGQSAFLRCWARAQRMEPGLSSTKVRLHIELDAAGKVIAIASDTDSATLSRCLAVVARQLPFPAPGKPAVVDLPLLFR